MFSPRQKMHVFLPLTLHFPLYLHHNWLLLASDMAQLGAQVVKDNTKKTNPLGIFLLASLQSDSFPMCHIYTNSHYSFLTHLKNFKLVIFLSRVTRSFFVQGGHQILYWGTGILQPHCIPYLFKNQTNQPPKTFLIKNNRKISGLSGFNLLLKNTYCILSPFPLMYMSLSISSFKVWSIYFVYYYIRISTQSTDQSTPGNDNLETSAAEQVPGGAFWSRHKSIPGYSGRPPFW